MKITPQLVKDFVQENEGYYAQAFTQVQKGKFSWNSAAALWGSAWMFYRRMYVNAGLFFIAEISLPVTVLHWASQQTIFPVKDFILEYSLLGIFFVTRGFLGNTLYFYFFQGTLAQGHKQKGVHNWVLTVCISFFLIGNTFHFFYPLLKAGWYIITS